MPTSRGYARSHMQGVRHAALDSSWFRMQLARDYVITAAGAFAGPSLGDALCLPAFSGVFRNVQFEPALYMDDMAVSTFSPIATLCAAAMPTALILRRVLQRKASYDFVRGESRGTLLCLVRSMNSTDITIYSALDSTSSVHGQRMTTIYAREFRTSLQWPSTKVAV